MQLIVSSYLTEHFCSSCQWWLKETNEKINAFRKNAQFWNDYLEFHFKPALIKDETEVVDGQPLQMVSQSMDEEEVVDDLELDEDGFKIEYLDADLSLDEDAGDPEYVHIDESNIEFVATADDDDDAVENYEEEILASDVDEETIQENGEDEQRPDSDEITSTNQGFGFDGRCDEDDSIGLSYWNVRTPVMECEMCGKQFKRKYAMTRHFVHEHGLVNAFSCESCSTVFPTKYV